MDRRACNLAGRMLLAQQSLRLGHSHDSAHASAELVARGEASRLLEVLGHSAESVVLVVVAVAEPRMVNDVLTHSKMILVSDATTETPKYKREREMTYVGTHALARVHYEHLANEVLGLGGHAIEIRRHELKVAMHDLMQATP